MSNYNRANWKREIVLDRTALDSPLVKLAAYARDKATPAVRNALVAGSFGDALDDLLQNTPPGVLEDLTGEERAYCEGWALLARRQCYDPATDALDDAKLVLWIDQQLNQPPCIETMTG